mmetsp:Transcript_33972/g.72409  ORF Transcript_33972/g.72409 Transcript_33972/m.72409 type:complete len:267 (+) Transcript_33972:396-1196(+)
MRRRLPEEVTCDSTISTPASDSCAKTFVTSMPAHLDKMTSHLPHHEWYANQFAKLEGGLTPAASKASMMPPTSNTSSIRSSALKTAESGSTWLLLVSNMRRFSQMSGSGRKLDTSSISGAGRVIARTSARFDGQTRPSTGASMSSATSCIVASIPPALIVALSDCSSLHARIIEKFRARRESSRISLTCASSVRISTSSSFPLRAAVSSTDRFLQSFSLSSVPEATRILATSTCLRLQASMRLVESCAVLASTWAPSFTSILTMLA